jgi:hypothetical protein
MISSEFHSNVKRGILIHTKRFRLQDFKKSLEKGHIAISKLMDLQIEVCKARIFLINQRTTI